MIELVTDEDIVAAGLIHFNQLIKPSTEPINKQYRHWAKRLYFLLLLNTDFEIHSIYCSHISTIMIEYQNYFVNLNCRNSYIVIADYGFALNPSNDSGHKLRYDPEFIAQLEQYLSSNFPKRN